MGLSTPAGAGRYRPSGIPRSRGSSREASPSRAYGLRYNLRASVERPKAQLTEKILRQSREAENALADALVSFAFVHLEQKLGLGIRSAHTLHFNALLGNITYRPIFYYE